MPTSPWPIHVGTLLLRDAGADDIEPLLVLRNDPVVNRFMLRKHVDPKTFRREWLAVPDSETDFSCVAELEKVGMRREQHGVEDSWHADLGGSMATSTRSSTASGTPTLCPKVAPRL